MLMDRIAASANAFRALRDFMAALTDALLRRSGLLVPNICALK